MAGTRGWTIRVLAPSSRTLAMRAGRSFGRLSVATGDGDHGLADLRFGPGERPLTGATKSFLRGARPHSRSRKTGPGFRRDLRHFVCVSGDSTSGARGRPQKPLSFAGSCEGGSGKPKRRRRVERLEDAPASVCLCWQVRWFRFASGSPTESSYLTLRHSEPARVVRKLRQTRGASLSVFLLRSIGFHHRPIAIQLEGRSSARRRRPASSSRSRPGEEALDRPASGLAFPCRVGGRACRLRRARRAGRRSGGRPV